MLCLTACSDTTLPTDAGLPICQATPTPVTTVQGDDYHSPLTGSALTVRGTVTRVSGDSGFYIEDSESPVNQRSSRALFVSDAGLTRSVEPGQQLALEGRVAELGTGRDTLTALIEISGHETCAHNVELPLTRAELPMNSRSREALEGMRVSFAQELTVTDVYKLKRGELTFSSAGTLRVPTEVVKPGGEANRLARENRNHSLVAVLTDERPAFPVGAITHEMAGLMGHDGRAQQLLLDFTPDMKFSLPLPAQAAGHGTVRAVSSNLLNFFNGDGRGNGFPTERGAASLDEFRLQSARTQAVMAEIRPDLLAVQELENDGFGPRSAARSLLDLLNGAGHDDWAFIAHGEEGIGGDVITVGLFYRQSVLQPVGASRVLDGPEFRGLSRQPLAQLFRHVLSGETFLVAVNHLKSKGRCPEQGENTDQNDGQHCWNQARVDAVKAELPWLDGLAGEMGTRNILVLGDMNAWRHEDPISQFTGSGLVDLVERLSGLPQYSFLYWGQTGTLDYVFASRALTRFARNAWIWHINAAWPAGMDLPLPWLRASDHDPVIVDFDFSQPATSR